MAPSLSSPHYSDIPFDISFSGSGFLSIYQLGVTLAFLKYTPWILQSAPHILGASAGSLVAATVACELNPILIRDEILLFAKQLKSFTLGVFNPSVSISNWLRSVLRKHLPSNAHDLANGRLCVAVTRMSDGKQLIISEFQSREDVEQALLCSCYLSGYCGFLSPFFNGERCMDGGVSGFLPRMPESSNSTLSVCPFSGDADICPPGPPCTIEMEINGVMIKGNRDNCRRMISALYPFRLEPLEQAFDSGYKDCIQFLWSKDLVSCVMSVSEGSPSYDPTNALKYLETTRVEEEEMRRENQASALTSFTDCRSKQMVDSTDPENTKDPPLHFEVVKNVLLGHVTSYLSMFGLPVIMLSNLLLPLVVSFYALLQSRQRRKLLLREAPEFVYGLLLVTKYFGLFFLNILICTTKRHITDR
ncbi:patatin-like phospholipase domain-containing protein 2 [Nothobranchius furzeri]|uniref:Patatin-like phospholipase domain-containing protein 2 n=2 Tax=Nothobranchius furzeri TaxID=105023 RepID=A0A9D3BKC9_NOTFU|nr:patatin-like phospholipase domain-containing protein 2 [Nothobranchius furzeri]